jgi:cbb3-type cytochrome oxidase cytochrome c subunit/cytochrome c553
MKMTEKVIAIGGLLILAAAAFSVAILPWITRQDVDVPSDTARPYTALEARGREVYIESGCTYCHTQYVRPQDWDNTATRISQPGDYYYDKPHLLGAHRTGPDLSQEGGMRPADWHLAHFFNPRYTRPASLMPEFKYLSKDDRDALIAYVQCLGGKLADQRLQRLNTWHAALAKAYDRGPDANFAYLHTLVPPQWRTMPNPYAATETSVARGKFVYEQECIGCHGNFGDGNGPAAKFLYPKPANFSTLRRIGASGGLLYYQIMNGITGTGMMSFKRELESEKIWDVSNYVATTFIGHNDARTAPRSEDEIQEPVEGYTLPPDPDKINALPLTSPALQPDQDAANKRNKANGTPFGRPEGPKSKLTRPDHNGTASEASPQ